MRYTTARDYMDLARATDGCPYGFRNDDAAASDSTEHIEVIDNAELIAEAAIGAQLSRERGDDAKAARQRYLVEENGSAGICYAT